MAALTLHVDALGRPNATATSRLRAFARAVGEAVGMGMLAASTGAGRPSEATVAWSDEGRVTISFDPGDDSLLPQDEDLLVRGLANCLDMGGIDVKGGAPAVPPFVQDYFRALAAQRDQWDCVVIEDDEWRCDDAFHVRLISRSAFDRDAVALVAGVLETFGGLVWGMYPLQGDHYSDAGETTVVHLEANVMDLSMDGVYGLPADWQRRLEAALLARQEKLRLRELRYEP